MGERLYKDNTHAEKKDLLYYLDDYVKEFLRDTAYTMERQTKNRDNYKFNREYYSHPDLYDKLIFDCKYHINSEYTDSDSSSILIIKGNPGIGKTAFLDKGIYETDDLKADKDRNRIYLNYRYENNKPDEKKLIAEINEKILFIRFKNKELNDECYKFEDILKAQLGDLIKQYDAMIGMSRNIESICKIIVYSKALHQCYKLPCNIIIDNLDLHSHEYQKDFIYSSINFFNFLDDINKHINLQPKNKLNLIIALRPDTVKTIGELPGVTKINFPKPQVYKICINNLRLALNTTAEKEEYRKHKFTLELNDNIIIRSFNDLASYLLTLIDKTVKDSWVQYEKNYGYKFMSVEFQDFHNKLTNNNIRKFNVFIINCLKNGGFIPLDKKFHEGKHNFRIYEYIRMLILGGYERFTGNDKNDGESFDPDSPLVFNLFEVVTQNGEEDGIIRNYFMYVRILQYIDCVLGGMHNAPEKEEGINVKKLIKDLSLYYEKKDLEDAIKKMIFTGLLIETNIGARNLDTDYIGQWDQIKLENQTSSAIISCSYNSSAMFYLYDLLCEYEYIYQMARVSHIYKIDIQFENIIKLEEESKVLEFLYSLYNILKLNIEHYKKENVFDQFKYKFLQDYIHDNNGLHPWKRMVNNYIKVLNHKIELTKKDGTSKEKRCHSLEILMEHANNLMKEGNDYFSKFK